MSQISMASQLVFGLLAVGFFIASMIWKGRGLLTWAGVFFVLMTLVVFIRVGS